LVSLRPTFNRLRHGEANERRRHPGSVPDLDQGAVMNDLNESVPEQAVRYPQRNRRSVRGIVARSLVAVTAMATVGAMASSPAHADVWAGSGYGTTSVRCESSALTLNTMVTALELDGTVFIKPTIYNWSSTTRTWASTSLTWKQIWTTISLPFTAIPHGYYYVKMDYAFGTSHGWVYRSEWITDYQSGAYNALSYCAV
jgi:hypothetical protein